VSIWSGDHDSHQLVEITHAGCNFSRARRHHAESRSVQIADTGAPGVVDPQSRHLDRGSCQGAHDDVFVLKIAISVAEETLI